jgi:hypothetical protein
MAFFGFFSHHIALKNELETIGQTSRILTFIGAGYLTINLKRVSFSEFFWGKAENHPGCRRTPKITECVIVNILNGRSLFFYAGKNSSGLVSFKTVRS